MSDSSEEEDLSRFKEAVDSTFVKLINETRDGNPAISDKNSIELTYCNIIFKNLNITIEAGRGAAARGVTAKPPGCGFESHSRR